MIAEISNHDILKSIQSLQRIQTGLHANVGHLHELGSPVTPHQFQHGDLILVKRHCKESLASQWKGSCIVIQATPMAVKVERSTPECVILIWSLLLRNIRTQPRDGLSSLIHRTHKKTSTSRARMGSAATPRGHSEDKTCCRLTVVFCFIFMIIPCSTLGLVRPNNYKQKTWLWRSSDTKIGRVITGLYHDDYSQPPKIVTDLCDLWPDLGNKSQDPQVYHSSP